MRKWKRMMSVFLTGAMVLGGSLTAVPEQAQAAEVPNETSVSGTLESKVLSDGSPVYLGPEGGTIQNGQKMFTWTGGTGKDQNWKVKEIEETGIYQLGLDAYHLAAGSVSEDAYIILANASEEDTAQQWAFESAGGSEGYYRIKNVKSGLYLTTPRKISTDTKDGQYIIQKSLDESSDSQLWKPSFSVKEASDLPDPEPDPDADAVKGYLTSKSAPAQHLSVDGGTADDGLGIIIWPGPKNDQEWVFQTTETQGEYVLKNVQTQKVITADGVENSQLVQKTYAEGDSKQIWLFETIGSDDTGYRIKNKATNYYITAESVNNLARVCQKALDDTASLQVWMTDAQIDASEGTPITKPKDVDHLSSAADEKQYLTVSGGSVKEGSELMTWTGPEDNQRWKFQETQEGSGEYHIVSTNSNKAASAQNMLEGKRLVQKSIVDGDETQIWSFVKADGDDNYRIKNKATHLYLTADASTSASKILQKNYMDSLLQIWHMAGKTAVNTIQDTEDCAIKIWITDGVTVTSDQGAAVEKGKPVTFTLTPRDGYEVKDMRLLINGTEQTLTNGENGTMTCTVSSAAEDMTVQAKADVTCLDGYVYIPENDYTGRNQCLSPRVVEGTDGTLYATFENGIPSEIEEGEYSFPIYESKDKGNTWKRVGEVINDDTVHPDSYYRITKYTDEGAPSEAVEVQQGDEGAVRHPWSLQCCPQLFVLPEDQGDLKKGTLVLAGVAVPLEEGAETVSDAGFGGLWDSSLDFYYSTDGGRSWTFKSIIAEGGENGRNIMGYDPVWEPFFLYHEDNLICYYSDETDPAHAQKLVYKITKDGGATWGEPVDIVSINNRGARPGMPIVTELENGDWMMVYETVGMTNPIRSGVKIAKDPYNWNPSDPGPTLPDINGVFGGSPYVFTLKDGRVVAGTGSLSEVFVNTKNDGTGEWIAKETGAPAGYNRCFFQLSTGEFFITGTEGPGFASQGNKIFVKRVWADEVPGADKPGDGDNTGSDKPGDGDNTGSDKPGDGDNTGSDKPGDGDNTGSDKPGDGDNTGSDKPGTETKNPVTKITISGISHNIAAGKKISLSAKVLPADASNRKLSWKSSNTKVATVTQAGVVTLKKNTGGKSVTITALATDGSGEKATYKITSMKGVVSKISLSGVSKKIAAGKKIKLTAKITASKSANKKLSWKSSNTKTATVSSSGMVTLKKNTGGKSVTITVSATDGSGKKATYKITSMKGIVKKVAISGKTSVKAGKTIKLKAKVTASKNANKTVKWTTSNKKYASVSSTGKVKAYKAGKGKRVKITAASVDGSGKKKTVTIKIK